MKRNKHNFVSIEIFVLALIALLSFTVLNTEYLFGWAAHNLKFYLVLCVVPLVLLFLNKKLISAFITIGVASGIFVGNYLGALIMRYNEKKIVEGMNVEEIYRLKHHPGFEIWIVTILLSTMIGTIIQIIYAKKYK